jgi:hypothetical protein
MKILHRTSSPRIGTFYGNVESKYNVSGCRPANNELSRKT